MNQPAGEKGSAGRGAVLRNKKLKAIRCACGVWIIYAIAAGALIAKQMVNMQIVIGLCAVGLVCLLSIMKMAAGLSGLKKLQDVGKYQYDKIAAITAEKEWMTLLADLFITVDKQELTLWLTVVTGGNIYMYVPAQTMSLDEIEAAVAALIGDQKAGRRIYAYEDFDAYEDMMMMLAANKPVKKEDDSQQVCEQLLVHAK